MWPRAHFMIRALDSRHRDATQIPVRVLSVRSWPGIFMEQIKIDVEAKVTVESRLKRNQSFGCMLQLGLENRP
jgi:hypothetical protein